MLRRRFGRVLIGSCSRLQVPVTAAAAHVGPVLPGRSDETAEYLAAMFVVANAFRMPLDPQEESIFGGFERLN